VLVPGLPDTQPAGDDVHRLKNVVVGHDHTLYVDIGSSSNASVPPPVPKGGYPRAAVLAFHPTFLTGSTLPARWASGAVVAGHGSWDRQPPRPPVVYWLAWNAANQTLGRATVLVSGFQESDGSRWGRLSDAVAGPDGSLYVTDDRSGAVYRITP
jgi:glucose/arabinose dehydrogenase